MLASGCASLAPLTLATEEFMVPSGDPGIDLYVRNKHPAGRSAFSGDKVLLDVHGATYAASTSFDLQLNGMSWMDYIAQNNDKVNQLVLNAPQWIRSTASLTDTGGELGAYRSVQTASAKARWLTGVP